MKKDERFTIRLQAVEKQMLIKKSGVVPLSAVIRLLLRMWLSGEIEIDFSTEETKNVQ